MIRTLAFCAALALAANALTSTAFAAPSELDNEARITNEQMRLASDLPATVVTRTNQATGEVEILHSKETLESDAATVQALATQGEFSKVAADARIPVTELDRDSSKSSWYFYWYNYSYSWPSYYYYGYNYRYYPYYSYYYGGYSYNFYRWYW